MGEINREDLEVGTGGKSCDHENLSSQKVVPSPPV